MAVFHYKPPCSRRLRFLTLAAHRLWCITGNRLRFEAVAFGVIPTGPDHMRGHLQQVCNQPFTTWFWAQGRIICRAARQAELTVYVAHKWPSSERKLVSDFAPRPVGISHGVLLCFFRPQGELAARLLLGLNLCVYTDIVQYYVLVNTEKGSNGHYTDR